MKKVLVFIESSSGLVSKSSLAVISAGLKAKIEHGMDSLVGVLFDSLDVARSVDSFGLDEIVVVKSESLNHFIPSVYAEALASVVKEISPSLVLASASSRGRDFIPYLSSILDAPQASDVIDFLPGGLIKRPMYAGNIIAEVELEGDLKVATIRNSAFSTPEASTNKAVIKEINLNLNTCSHTEVLSFDTVKSERPELGDADVVVSGGRAMKSAENFETVLAPLADILGAAIGASRAAVDSGFAPNDWQVGQTGKIVAPNLYIAVGISGAVQHLAGMKDSKVIVAINKDPEAPIFEVADYGLVADLYQVVPELTEKIKAAKS